MDSEGRIDLKKLNENNFSAIVWLNNVLRREKAHNEGNNADNLENKLLTISQSCTSIMTEYTELIESKMEAINDMLSDFISSSDDNKSAMNTLINKINECSGVISKTEQKYKNNNLIEEIITLFEKKEKLENVMKLLINNSKFESLLSEIEYVLKDKDNFISLIKGQGEEFYDIIDKICLLKLLVSSLESIPEFLNRIERFKLLEKSVISILDDIFLNLFIFDPNNESLFDLLNIYSKLDQDSKVYEYVADILVNQINLVWNLVWSLTTFGSQNGRNVDFDSTNENNNKNLTKIIYLSSIQDLEGIDISQDMLRISEDDAIRRYFSWFSELIVTREKIIDNLFMRFKDRISDFINKIINTLIEVCLYNIKEFLNTILITITNSIFIFPENDCEKYDVDNDSIFGINQDSILTTDVREIHTVCERILVSVIKGLNVIIYNDIEYKSDNISMNENIDNENSNNSIKSIISNCLLNDESMMNNISEMLLNSGNNVVQSILLCDISSILQILKKISIDMSSVINSKINIADYSKEIESMNNFLIDRINHLFKKDKAFDSGNMSINIMKPLPNKDYILLFVDMIDYSAKYYFENELIRLLNPIQNIIRTQTLNLVKNLSLKLNGNMTIINSLDKELLNSCFLFYCTILKTRKIFKDVIFDTIVHCKSVDLSINSNHINRNNDDNDNFDGPIISSGNDELKNQNVNSYNDNYNTKFMLTLKLFLVRAEMDLSQYSIFNRIKNSIPEKLNEELNKLLFCNGENLKNKYIDDLVNDLESVKIISQISLDSIEIMSQCCSYPILASLEGYKRLELWCTNRNLNYEINDNELSNRVEEIEGKVITYIEKNKIQPSNLMVSIGEYLLNIAVIVESTFNSNTENNIVKEFFVNSEINLIPKIIEKVSVIVFDSIKRQIIDIEEIETFGYINLFVDVKYLISIFDILVLYNNEFDDSKNISKELNSLSQSLMYIIMEIDYLNSKHYNKNDSKIEYWYRSLIQKRKQ
ncbi:hypothetical protein FG386_000605 [Cryptosporidium ryanae]|uniref:uncharacterized protein n=1 Tax=Cryptosporidium ryanae TaxID=515981 RepID=UPI00351A7A03|nr:hypothetical protein FG386_000605 [Cryptosporidium ryanae]